MGALKTQPKWVVGLKAMARSLVALVPAMAVRWYMTKNFSVTETEADTVAAAVGALIKFLFSSGTAQSVAVKGN